MIGNHKYIWGHVFSRNPPPITGYNYSLIKFIYNFRTSSLLYIFIYIIVLSLVRVCAYYKYTTYYCYENGVVIAPRPCRWIFPVFIVPLCYAGAIIIVLLCRTASPANPSCFVCRRPRASPSTDRQTPCHRALRAPWDRPRYPTPPGAAVWTRPNLFRDV